jgi:hypothetical protein
MALPCGEYSERHARNTRTDNRDSFLCHHIHTQVISLIRRGLSIYQSHHVINMGLLILLAH